MEYKKIIAWGTGSTSHRILSNMIGINEYISYFVDKYYTKNQFFGKKVIKTSDLMNIYNDEYIIVFSNQFFNEIVDEANKLGIGRDKLIYVGEWLESVFLVDTNIILKPRNIRLEACTLCQLDCVTCYMRNNNYGSVGKGWLKSSNFKKFIEQNNFIENIELSNNGEVFLNPEIDEILRIAHGKVNLTINNGTNFNTLTEKQIETIVKYEVKSITISIDGASQEVYSKYRRNGDFEAVINNIKLLKGYKEKYNSKYPVLRWQYVLMKENEGDIEKAIEIARQMGMEIVFKLDWSGEYSPKNPDKVHKLTGYEVFNRKDWKTKYGFDYVREACSQMIYEPQINWDGTLLGCCGNYKDNWGVNVFEKGLIKAMNSGIYRNAVAGFFNGNHTDKLQEVCKKCNGHAYTLNSTIQI